MGDRGLHGSKNVPERAPRVDRPLWSRPTWSLLQRVGFPPDDATERVCWCVFSAVPLTSSSDMSLFLQSYKIQIKKACLHFALFLETAPGLHCYPPTRATLIYENVISEMARTHEDTRQKMFCNGSAGWNICWACGSAGGLKSSEIFSRIESCSIASFYL